MSTKNYMIYHRDWKSYFNGDIDIEDYEAIHQFSCSPSDAEKFWSLKQSRYRMGELEKDYGKCLEIISFDVEVMESFMRQLNDMTNAFHLKTEVVQPETEEAKQ